MSKSHKKIYIFFKVLAVMVLANLTLANIGQASSKLSSLDRNQAQVLYWAGTSAVQALSFNFMTLRQDFQRSSQLFTLPAWSAFSKSLQASGILDNLKDSKMGMRAVPTDVPLIINQDNSSGIYTWTVQMPMLITMQSSTKTKQLHWNIKLVIERAPAHVGVDGLAISSFIASPQQPPTPKKK